MLAEGVCARNQVHQAVVLGGVYGNRGLLPEEEGELSSDRWSRRHLLSMFSVERGYA